jgi:hypothetical protein
MGEPYRTLMSHWIPIAAAMNAMNRSMGNRDFCPFALSPGINEKLRFVHDLVGEGLT